MADHDTDGDLSLAPDHWEHEPVRTRRPWWFWLATAFGAVILFFSAAFVALYYLYAPDLPITADLGELNRTPSITMTDEAGKTFASRGAAFGYRVKVEEMPTYLPAAFIVTEDRRFYTHSGVDFRGLVRAMYTNWRAGSVVQGGSTITQQLAKNTFLKPERTWSRKFEEMFLAFWLERHYSKDEILTLYLNRIYLGSGAYGVDAAAREYFDKSVRDVTLAEAAMLAALTRAPTRYSPETNLKLAQQRANLVIRMMLEDDLISEAEAKKATANPAKPVFKEEVESANYFADFVVDQLAKLKIKPEKDMIVRTTINTKLQTAAQKNLTAILAREGKGRAVSQAALIAMEPSGAIRSVVGGRDYTQSIFNRAYQAHRQPGSSFKPFVYLAALVHGLTPDDIYPDEPYENRGWMPENYDGTYAGDVTLREALAKSINTVAVRVADEVGRRKIIEIAQAMGIESPLEPNRSLPLGTSEVTLYEMTRAFAVMANNGNKVEPYVILEAKTVDGTVLYQHTPKAPQRLLSPLILGQINEMMYEVIQTGTGQRGNLDPRPVGGKTGTSQEWRDAWFIGYTANYVTGVWVGNDDGTPMGRVVGGSIPASIWKAYMVAAHRNLPILGLPGVDEYANQPDTENGADYEDNPWVERDSDGNPRDDRGPIEEFFDGLFGSRESETRAPPPPPAPRPPAPDPADGEPEADPETGGRAVPLEGEERPAPGPYRQPEEDPEAAPPF